MVFAWPTAFSAIAAAAALGSTANHAKEISVLFLAVFALNLLILSFEFSRSVTLTLLFAAIAAGAGIYFLQQHVDVYGKLINAYAKVDLKVPPQFLYAVAAAYGFAFVAMFLGTRLDYWQITATELVHRRGILGGTERYPLANLKMNKEIDDIFEFLLGGSGRLTLRVPGRHEPIVLENVLGVNGIEKKIETILIAKKMPPPPPSGTPVFAVGVKAPA